MKAFFKKILSYYLYFYFTIFVIKNFFFIKKFKTVLFFISLKKFIGSGFGHYSVVSSIFQVRGYDTQTVLMIDYTKDLYFNKFNICNAFGIKNLDVNIPKIYKNFFLKDRVERKKIIKKLTYLFLFFFGKQKDLKIFSSLDNFYLSEKKKRIIFFKNYSSLDQVNSEISNIKKKPHKFSLARANSDIQEIYKYDEFKLHYDQSFFQKLDFQFSKNLVKNNKNVLLYRRQKQNDFKCGSKELNYYLDIIKLINPNSYNILCVGDFSNEDKKRLINHGSISNLDENFEKDFYVWASIISDMNLLECGGGLSLPVLLTNKNIIFNNPEFMHLFPNTILIPKIYKKNKKNLNVETIIKNYMGGFNLDNIEVEYCSPDLLYSEFLFLIKNNIKNYQYQKVKNFEKYFDEFKRYNCFLSNNYLKRYDY